MESITLTSLVPYLLGGIIMSGAVCLDLNLEKRVPSPSTTLYNLITIDSYTKWRSGFLAGFMFTSGLLWHIFGSQYIPFFQTKLFEPPDEFLSGISAMGFLLGGFQVGVGTKLADGGLTKFGFYGLPRLSKRAILALCIIIGIGGIVATFRSEHPFFVQDDLESFARGFDSRFAMIVPIGLLLVSYIKSEAKREVLISFLIGCLLSAGALLSGFAQRHKMIHFLTFNKNWDPFLLVVLASGIVLNFFFFQVLLKHNDSITERAKSSQVEPKFVLGCCFLGAGLGLSGLTPGSALLTTPVYLPQMIFFYVPFVALGQFIADPLGSVILNKLHAESDVQVSHLKAD